MTDSPSYAVVSLPDIELVGQVECATRRLVVITPGLSEDVAKAISAKWRLLGTNAVHVALDLDPEVCRLGFGDLSAVTILHHTAQQLGTTIHHQPGLRVGVVVTDETTTVFSPVPRLVEAGGKPGERLNALRFDVPIAEASGNSEKDFRALDLAPGTVSAENVEATTQDLEANPPVKFDLAQKVRVFNSRFEFVELELKGFMVAKKQVRIPSDMMGLARDPKAQELLRSTFKLIESTSDLSGREIEKTRNSITKKWLIPLPGYGTVILRTNKQQFLEEINSLRQQVEAFRRKVERELQAAIDSNREILTAALLPTLLNAWPDRWKRYVGEHPTKQQLESMLRQELKAAFGNASEVLHDMKVNLVFKGVTYELLNDAEFVKLAAQKTRSIDPLHDEYEAAKAKEQSA